MYRDYYSALIEAKRNAYFYAGDRDPVKASCLRNALAGNVYLRMIARKGV
jgi:hypothetical protein